MDVVVLNCCATDTKLTACWAKDKRMFSVRRYGKIQVEVTLPLRQCRGETRTQPSRDRCHETKAQIPRISRLMALAIKFQEMVDRGEVNDYADLARLGYVTRARITQIMNLLNLSPDLQ
jgi:hypothetical protein